ncbi:hypothetical protein [Sphingobacterium sp. LRF_L2]|uniref:hypothetical protein n=1 Tax=Sphingobacterium sp. LRF_L2 TaxID=3369421 RepID=UPI003F5E19C9
MENQVEKNETLDAKGIIILAGTIFGALISIVASGTFLGFIKGIVIGLVFAIFFISVFLPHKPHDR